MKVSVGALLALSVGLLASATAALDVERVGADGGPGEDGESVRASGSETAENFEPVDVSVLARGGLGGPAAENGSPAGDGGRAGLGRVFGASDSGDVSVSGLAFGGGGGDAGFGVEAGPAGDGASVRLINRVEGDTRGRISLGQSALGGDAGRGPGGRGGGAMSVLASRKAAESLEVGVFAFAGGPAPAELPTPSGPSGGHGAPAFAAAIILILQPLLQIPMLWMRIGVQGDLKCVIS